jgi:hypothetical protein
MDVHARPVTTPAGVDWYILSFVNRGLPTKSCSSFKPTITFVASPDTILNAAFL